MNSSRSKVIILLFLSAFLLDVAYGQNLVRNCDFENMTGCPFAQGQINRCQNWYTPGNGSTDYVHACNGGNFSVPTNQWGYQKAHSEDAYAHVILYYSTNGTYREYLQTKLACELQAGKVYDVSFYISCTDNSRWAIDGVGAHLTVGPLVQLGVGIIELMVEVDISNPPGNVINNKDDWVKIQGLYTAQGGEKYITIGNFMQNGEMTIEEFPSWNGYYSSFYIDDVSVESLDPIFDLGPDTIICPGNSITYDIGSTCDNANLTWENGSESQVRTISSPGTYSIEGKIGCTEFYDQVVISYPDDPRPYLPPDTVICPQKILDIIPSGTYNTYLWQDGSNLPIYSTDTEGEFWLEVTDAYGCVFNDSISVSPLAPPSYYLGDDTLICIGTEHTLNPGVDSAWHHFTWSDYSTGTQLMVSDSGEYWLHLSNPCGDMSDTIKISTYNCSDVLIAPNAFTPNSDGLNDIFLVKAENISNFKMYVYDRWGTLLFESNSQLEGWNGEFKGSPAPTGTYVWMAIYDAGFGDAAGESKSAKGTVVLLR